VRRAGASAIFRRGRRRESLSCSKATGRGEKKGGLVGSPAITRSGGKKKKEKPTGVRRKREKRRKKRRNRVLPSQREKKHYSLLLEGEKKEKGQEGP